MQSPTKKMERSIPNEIENSINCCLWQSTTKMKHYAYKAIILPCGGNACKECVESYDGNVIACNFCENTHKKEEISKIENQLVERIIKVYLDDLKTNLVFGLQELKGEKTELTRKIDMLFDNIEVEVDIRVESIIAGLHEYIEDFKKEMDLMKQNFKESFKMKFNEKEKKMNDLIENGVSGITYEEFFEAQRILNESKPMLEKYVNNINKINFNPNTKIVYKELVGELTVPLGKQIEATETIEIECESNLIDCVYWESKDMLIVLDQTNNLKTYNFKTGESNSESYPILNNPCALCISKNDQLHVLDSIDGGEEYNILEFDKDFKAKFLSNFKYDASIRCVMYDSFDDRNFLFIPVDKEDCVFIIDVDSGREIERIEIDSPENIEFTKECLYITSYTYYELKEAPKGQLDEITYGSNCIFVLNRKYEIIDRISFDNWLQPYGISVQGDYILTLAFELDRNKVISNKIYLHFIKDKQVVRKVIMDNAGSSVYFFNNRAILLYSRTIEMIKFSDFE